MALLEGYSVKNFRVLKEISLGKTIGRWKASPLTPLVAVIGRNGTGKSTLFDSFGVTAQVPPLSWRESGWRFAHGLPPAPAQAG